MLANRERGKHDAAHGADPLTSLPRIAVSMPARNAARWIGSALESVLRQDGVDVHVVVVDDASSDRTVEVASAYAGDRVTVLRNGSPRGIGACHNQALDATDAGIVSHVDADDVIEPGALRKLADALGGEAAVGQAYCDFYPIDEAGREDPRLRAAWASLFRTARAKPIDYGRQLVTHGMVVSALRTYRREVFERVGRFDETLPWAVDYEMALRVAEHYDFAHVPEMLYGRRLHGAGASQGPRARALRHWWMRWRLVRRALRRNGGTLYGHGRAVTTTRLARGLPPALLSALRSNADTP